MTMASKRSNGSDSQDAPPTKKTRVYTEEEVQMLIAETIAKQAQPLEDTFFCNDPVHGTVQLPKIAKQIIDTKTFQRLRHIRQLSTVHFVYPGAQHCRFMHSIGTAHLAYSFIKSLRHKHPKLNVTVPDVLCVTLAALCHDLGHPAFSHMFEVFMHQKGKHLRMQAETDAAQTCTVTEATIQRYESWAHEAASVKLLEKLFEDLKTQLQEAGLSDVDLICVRELIDPPKKRLEGLLEKGTLHEEWGNVIHGRPVEKAWMYEIVSNWRSGVDVDKFDYFKRDAHFLGITNPFRHDRYMASVKVVCDKGGVPTISPPEKESDSLRDNFCEIRKFLHSQAYSHKTSVKLATHMIDILMMMDEHVRIVGTGGRSMRMSEAALDVDSIAYMMLTDTFVEAQLLGCDPGLSAARAEYDLRFVNRQLMRLVAGWDVPLPGEFNVSAGPLELPTPDNLISELLKEYNNCAETVSPELDVRNVPACEVRYQLIKIHGGMGERDPISRIHFHSKHDGAGVLALAEGQAPPLRRRLFIFWNPESNREDRTTLQRLTIAFKNWAASYINKHETQALLTPYTSPVKKRVLQMKNSCPPDP